MNPDTDGFGIRGRETDNAAMPHLGFSQALSGSIPLRDSTSATPLAMGPVVAYDTVTPTMEWRAAG